VDRHYLPGKEDTFSWQRSDAFFLANGFPAGELRRVEEENPAKQLAPAPYDDYLPVSEGDIFSYGGYTLEVIDTPGHTPGHQCLYEREHQMLFLGDHVLFDITPNITAWAGTEDSLGKYLTSLKKLQSLPVTLPLPAHRASGADFHHRVGELLEHHDRRCREVVEILTAHPGSTAYETASRMTWQIRCRNWEEFPLAQKWFAVGEAIAHLEHLAAEGIVSAQQQQDGTIRYTAERRERP
jgi:glyoxylase-like metal-dependent hydrolase (beta-lactamase superfamily II)